MENEYFKNELNDLRDDIRNIKAEYVKIDSLDYKEIKEKIKKISEETTELKVNFKNLNVLMEKNNLLTETLHISNTKLTTILENVVDSVGGLQKDIKEMEISIRKIDLETSKNTDSRLSIKQLFFGVLASIIMLIIGAALAQSGITPK